MFYIVLNVSENLQINLKCVKYTDIPYLQLFVDLPKFGDLPSKAF